MGIVPWEFLNIKGPLEFVNYSDRDDCDDRDDCEDRDNRGDR